MPGGSSGNGRIRIGICLSGGGIRSASFSLGVCQRLIEAGILSRADYLSAVSGGSYLAAAMAISNAGAGEAPQMSEPPPWSRGSPEESELRRNLTYLAPGISGRLWLGANVLYGMVLNLLPLVLAAYLTGRVLGLFLDALYPGVGNGSTDWSSLPLALGLGGALAASALAVVGVRRFLDRSDPPRPAAGNRSETGVMWLLLAAGLVLLVGAVLPAALDLLAHLSWGGVAEFEAVGLGFSLRRLIVGIGLVVFSLCLGGAAVWLLRRRRLPIVRALFAYLSGAGILVAPFLLGALTGVDRPWSNGTDVPLFLGTLATIVVFGLFVHNSRYSMHPFYRERIQAAFASRRTYENGEVKVEPIPYERSIFLSQVAAANARAPGGRRFPQLIMCAAVAARGSEVPNKSWAASFTFEGEWSGNRRLIWAPTRKFEKFRAQGGDELTLPAMMAISGAAISPLMGRFTLPAFRFLMAMMNIRLGVWIRNPKRRSVNHRSRWGRAMRWLIRPDGTRWRRRLRSLVRRWQEPGALYVLKEGLGLAKADAPYVYVSDGGHWENLGLTELLRQGCTHVIAVDASGDPGLGDVGRAMSVARAELGVDFSLDPRKTLGKDGKPSISPVAVGSFTYPEGDVVGQIYYCRSVLWRGAPSDLHLFAAEDSRFPNHPTSNQFLSGELFDAYRGLGWAAGKELTDVLKKKVPPAARKDGEKHAWIIGHS